MVKPSAALPSCSNTVLNRKQRKQKRKFNHKKRRQAKKGITTNNTMSSWTENISAAANWQLKHQIAYWKAKAVALHYENKVLEEIIKKYYHADPNALSENDDSVSNVQTYGDTTPSTSNRHSESENSENDEEQDEEDGSDFEASEELIQFLAQNAKYREDARRERQILKDKQNQERIEREDENSVVETTENKVENAKKLYGDKWQIVMALETSVLTNFLSESDKTKPSFWPNIPFNFNI